MGYMCCGVYVGLLLDAGFNAKRIKIGSCSFKFNALILKSVESGSAAAKRRLNCHRDCSGLRCTGLVSGPIAT